MPKRILSIFKMLLRNWSKLKLNTSLIQLLLKRHRIPLKKSVGTKTAHSQKIWILPPTFSSSSILVGPKTRWIQIEVILDRAVLERINWKRKNCSFKPNKKTERLLLSWRRMKLNLRDKDRQKQMLLISPRTWVRSLRSIPMKSLLLKNRFRATLKP